jgi:hypothetical protein
VHFVGVEIPAVAQDVDWRLHNLDLAGSRYAEIDQITPENAHSLTPRWLFQHGVIDGVSNQTTPIVVDGVMYLTMSLNYLGVVDAKVTFFVIEVRRTRMALFIARQGLLFLHWMPRRVSRLKRLATMGRPA